MAKAPYKKTSFFSHTVYYKALKFVSKYFVIFTESFIIQEFLIRKVAKTRFLVLN